MWSWRGVSWVADSVEVPQNLGIGGTEACLAVRAPARSALVPVRLLCVLWGELGWLVDAGMPRDHVGL
jgi:hypothetical protein